MPALAIAQREIVDAERYKTYLAGFMPVFKQHGGMFLGVRSGEMSAVEGVWAHSKTVVMQIGFCDDAKCRLVEPGYETSAQHRYAFAQTDLAGVDGLG